MDRFSWLRKADDETVDAINHEVHQSGQEHEFRTKSGKDWYGLPKIRNDYSDLHGQKVEVHRNLNVPDGKALWSVYHKGKLLFYTPKISLDNPSMHVHEHTKTAGGPAEERERVRSGKRSNTRQAAIAMGQKNVHAVVEGLLAPHRDEQAHAEEPSARVSYNPFGQGHFFQIGKDMAPETSPVHSGSHVTMGFEPAVDQKTGQKKLRDNMRLYHPRHNGHAVLKYGTKMPIDEKNFGRPNPEAVAADAATDKKVEKSASTKETMGAGELVNEHKRLVGTLRSHNPKKLDAEASRQEKELRHYENDMSQPKKLEKARIDQFMSPKAKRLARDERRVASSSDKLAAKVTKKPGVSKQGATVRARLGKSDKYEGDKAPSMKSDCSHVDGNGSHLRKSKDGGCWYCGNKAKGARPSLAKDDPPAGNDPSKGNSTASTGSTGIDPQKGADQTSGFMNRPGFMDRLFGKSEDCRVTSERMAEFRQRHGGARPGLAKDDPPMGNDPSKGNSMASTGSNGIDPQKGAEISNSFTNRPGVMDRLFGKSEDCRVTSERMAEFRQRHGMGNSKDTPGAVTPERMTEFRQRHGMEKSKKWGVPGEVPSEGMRKAGSDDLDSGKANSNYIPGNDPAPAPDGSADAAKKISGFFKTAPKADNKLEKAKEYNPQKKVQNFNVNGPEMPKVTVPRVPKVPDPTTKIRDVGPIKKSQYAKTEEPAIREAKKAAERKNESKKDKINQELKQEVIAAVATKGGTKYDGMPAKPKKTMRTEKKMPANSVTNSPKKPSEKLKKDDPTPAPDYNASKTSLETKGTMSGANTGAGAAQGFVYGGR